MRNHDFDSLFLLLIGVREARGQFLIFSLDGILYDKGCILEWKFEKGGHL